MDGIVKQRPTELQWEPAHTPPWLAAGDVHLWRARLDAGFPMPVLRDNLTVREAIHAERLHDARERRQFVASRGLLRAILGCYLQMEPVEVPLAGSADRLRLAAPYDDVRFDLAVAGEIALVAISRGPAVGLDIETVRENVPFAEMASHYFEPGETWSVVTTRGAERARRFFELWTGQEAARRAGGGGGTAVSQLAPAEGCAAALAVSGGEFRLACWDWQAAA